MGLGHGSEVGAPGDRTRGGGPGERRQYLSFTVAGADQAIGILRVKEILQFEGATRVPSVPASVRGVINLRGTVVPIIDLALKLGLRETPITRRTCVVIVESSVGEERTAVGVLADSVNEVLDLGAEDVEPPPAFGAGVKVDYLLGMGKVGSRLVLLLDIDRVLSAEEKELALHPPGAPPAA